ncbi:MAG TPA: hypothetical protein VGC97_16660 [Pyrinomonadaceae bacterium]|jgi:hypothetical protein
MRKKTAQNKNHESSVKWVELVRNYLSRRNDSFLRKAVFEAQKLGEFEIVEYLEIVADPDTGDIEQLTDNLISTLDAASFWVAAAQARGFKIDMHILFRPFQTASEISSIDVDFRQRLFVRRTAFEQQRIQFA